jgi:folate-binding protein YgfZ
MDSLSLHPFHQNLDAHFFSLQEKEAVEHYGDIPAEYAALRQSAGVLDLSFRSRLCVLGADRRAFLNGQVTNNVKDLHPGEGCYAALVNAKGKMESDLNIYCLENELLLDFEPGLTAAVQSRLEKYIIAEDAQIADIAPDYGLLSVQGPRAAAALESLGFAPPQKLLSITRSEDAALGEFYVANQPRFATSGFDLFIPTTSLLQAAERLLGAIRAIGGRSCGWAALEIARIEAGVPRFGQDMDNTNLPGEAGLDARAISYSKGCYIGQEIIARIRTYGQVAKSLRGLRLPDDLPELPGKGAKLFLGDKEVGIITSATASPTLSGNIALAYIRREAAAAGTELLLTIGANKFRACVVNLPFKTP